MLILDGSGSMTQADAPGPRIDAAKNAAHGLIGAMPESSTIGLQTYGTTTDSAPEDKPAGCRDVTTLIPLGPLDRDKINAAIDPITPSGYTPISLALTAAAHQLPADETPQAIVLVSDGEETCDTPPCDTAAHLKQTHPGLTISTVGFKVEGPAADQLRCIAEATGGIFIQAANADQLAARLLATQDIDQANTSLSATGFGDIALGTTVDDIRAKHADFPDVADTGSVTVTWIDCDFGFNDGTLESISPHNHGHTIDGVTVGDPVTEAGNFYGEPLSATPNSDGTTTVIFDADPNSDHAYKMTVDGYTRIGDKLSGTIRTIALCRCKPRASANPTRPSGVNDDTIRSMTLPAGTCGNGSYGWENTVPITLTEGRGEARTSSGEFAGASIKDATLLGWLDADGDGTEDAVVSFVCFGSTFDMCCAGRSSMMKFLRVFDFSAPTPQPVGETIMPGNSPVRGETYGEARFIDQVRVDASAILTEEKLIYPDSVEPTADLGHSPYATIEVTHRFTNGQWTSSDRVIR
ncbi:VWA domain-containing protein [Mycobacterium sp. 852014-52144_SCH5372336]|uniref:vWA domain-containing protein n=1 Tax=Mycobacterium sp. 852014-52144_SCH5372336 TaxID=1834115 RepID=UPI001E61CA49|nr:VWA domain-containing protein [Mycobacterium sp. 852014-52144_SCH5372336]